MNVDYTLAPSPAMARKLAAIKSVTRVDVDDALLRQAGEQLLTHDQVAQTLPGSLVQYLHERTLDVIQHAADYDYRFVMGTRNFAQSAAYSLMAAFQSGKKIAIINTSYMKRDQLWQTFLKKHNLPYQYVFNDDATVDHEQPILVFELTGLSSTTLNRIRERVMLYTDKLNTTYSPFGRFRGEDMDLDQLFGGITLGTSVEVLKEFPHVIASFHGNHKDQTGRPFEWWRDEGFRTLARSLYPDLAVERVLSNQSVDQNMLLQMGFTMTSPAHMARLLGIHVRLFTDSNADGPQEADN